MYSAIVIVIMGSQGFSAALPAAMGIASNRTPNGGTQPPKLKRYGTTSAYTHAI